MFRCGNGATWLDWLAFAGTRAFVLAFLSGIGSDLHVQQAYATRLLAGEIPYHDFHPEYPPLALAFGLLPALATVTDREWYIAYRVLMLIIDAFIWWRLTTRVSTEHRTAAKVLYLSGTTFLGPLLYDRMDLALGALLLEAVLALQAGKMHGFHFWIGIGIAFKLIPIVLLPWALAKQARTCFRGLPLAAALLGGPTAISFAEAYLYGGNHLLSIFQYHGERPVQLESVCASIEMLMIAAVDVPGVVTHDHGSFNLVTDYGHQLSRASSIFLAVLVLESAAWGYWAKRCRSADVLTVSFVLTAALCLSKVLSPQYFLWVLPVWAIAMQEMPPDQRRTTILSAEFAVILTALIYPWAYDSLIALDVSGQMLLIARNILLIVVTCELAIGTLVWVRGGATAAVHCGDLEGETKSALVPPSSIGHRVGPA